MQTSKIINKGSQIHGNIETHNDLVFENCIVGDVHKFKISYSEESAPVIFRNCVFNNEAIVIIETGNKTHIEINNLEMDDGSLFILKPDISCIVDSMKLEPFCSFQGPNKVKNIVMKDVIIRRAANIDLKGVSNPHVVYLNNISLGEESELVGDEVYDELGNLALVDVKIETASRLTINKGVNIKGEIFHGDVKI